MLSFVALVDMTSLPQSGTVDEKLACQAQRHDASLVAGSGWNLLCHSVLGHVI